VDYLTQLEGVEEIPSKVEITFQKEGEDMKFAPPTLAVTGKLGLKQAVQLEDFKFLKSVTDRTPKVTIPSPSMLHFRGGRGAISETAYPEMEGFYADLIKVYKKEIADLAAAGCRSIQMDDTNLAYLCDSNHRERARAIGEDPDALPALYAKLISECFAERPSDMAASIHLCRGNFRGAWAAAGGYEPVADVMFNQTKIDSFFLEFDDERSGGFEPLRFLPKGKVVVLGLISSKKGELESRDDIVRRIEEASKYADISQLAISPQCGFSSEEEGNDITFEQQEAKLELVVEVAREVWGTAS
jgi:5-methyltetrahydropteroyltriglutamate--homocysteine methyltransferase